MAAAAEENTEGSLSPTPTCWTKWWWVWHLDGQIDMYSLVEAYLHQRVVDEERRRREHSSREEGDVSP